jgi:hypothetical protein
MRSLVLLGLSFRLKLKRRLKIPRQASPKRKAERPGVLLYSALVFAKAQDFTTLR